MRQLPHNTHAEAALLSTLLDDPGAIIELGGRLEPDDFHLEDHRLICRAIQMLDRAQEPIGLAGVHDALRREGMASERIGAILEGVIRAPSSLSMLESYLRTVTGDARTRAMIRASQRVGEMGHEGMDADAYLAAAEAQILDVGKRRGVNDDVTDLAPAVREYLAMVQDVTEGTSGRLGAATALKDLDLILGDLQPERVTVLAGRPGMGKTATALQMCLNIAMGGERYAEDEHGRVRPYTADPQAVLFVSLEMTRRQVVQRALSNLAMVPLGRVISGELRTRPTRPDRASELERIVKASTLLMRLPLYVDDRRNRNIHSIFSTARRLAHKTPLGLIAIDYLQYIAPTDSRAPREQSIAEISRMLPDMAKTLDTHVMPLAQLNRECERRENKRPRMSDLRESGAIEQDADAIVFCYRDEYYNADTDTPGVMEAIVGKNRHGKTGTASMRFVGEYTRVTDLERWR